MESLRKMMAQVDADIFAAMGDTATINGTDVQGMFHNGYREVETENGPLIGLYISFDTQYTVLIGNLQRGDDVKIDGTNYAFQRRLPEKGDESGKVTLELGATE